MNRFCVFREFLFSCFSWFVFRRDLLRAFFVCFASSWLEDRHFAVAGIPTVTALGALDALRLNAITDAISASAALP